MTEVKQRTLPSSYAALHPFTNLLINSLIFRIGSSHTIWGPITLAQCVSLWNRQPYAETDQVCGGVKISRLRTQALQWSIFSLFTHHFSWVQVSATTIYFFERRMFNVSTLTSLDYNYFLPCSETFRKVILVGQCGSVSTKCFCGQKSTGCALRMSWSVRALREKTLHMCFHVSNTFLKSYKIFSLKGLEWLHKKAIWKDAGHFAFLYVDTCVLHWTMSMASVLKKVVKCHSIL